MLNFNAIPIAVPNTLWWLHIKKKKSKKLNYTTQTMYAVKHKPISLSRGYCCQEIRMSINNDWKNHLKGTKNPNKFEISYSKISLLISNWSHLYLTYFEKTKNLSTLNPNGSLKAVYQWGMLSNAWRQHYIAKQQRLPTCKVSACQNV